MQSERSIVTENLPKDILWNELRYVIAYFLQRNETRCSFSLGAGWGIDYYGTSEWTAESCDLRTLEEQINELEERRIGMLGDDDLFVDIGSVCFHFCHESDVHLDFREPSAVTEDFYQRWSGLGYGPQEFLTDDPAGPGTRIR